MNKRGAVLATVLVAVVVMYMMAVAALRSSLGAKIFQAKADRKGRAALALEAARAQAFSCLHQAAFPSAHCGEPLPACLPSSIGTPAATLVFAASGNYAADGYCKLAIAVTLPGD